MSLVEPDVPIARSALGDPPSYPIGSVDNALRLLQIFSEQKSVRIADASRELGVARSTAHRMIQMLQYRGFVSQDPGTRVYEAGPELIRMALSVVQRLDVRSVAEPVMRTIVEQVGETVHVAELRGSDVFFLNSIESSRSVRVGARTGMMLPAHGTATGKVLLAALEPAALRLRYPGAQLKALTAKTHTSRRTLEKELDVVREQGYATNFGESEHDVSSIAVPIVDAAGRVRVALAIAAPPSRLSLEMVPDVVTVLSEGAEQIGKSLPI